MIEVERASRCPYHRPFAAEFDDCPAFLPRLEMPADSTGEPLKPFWSCAHLGSATEGSGSFYPRCLLGGAAERERWAQAMGPDSIPAIRRARVESSHHIRPQLERLRLAMREVGARPAMLGGADAGVASAAEDLARSFAEFLEAHPELFRDAGLEPQDLRQCFGEAMREFLHRVPTGPWRMSDEIVRRYPWQVVAFFRPDLVTSENPGSN